MALCVNAPLLQGRDCALGVALCQRSSCDDSLLAARRCRSTGHSQPPGLHPLHLAVPCTTRLCEITVPVPQKQLCQVQLLSERKLKTTPPKPTAWRDSALRETECFQISKRITQTVGTTEMHIKIKQYSVFQWVCFLFFVYKATKK